VFAILARSRALSYLRSDRLNQGTLPRVNILPLLLLLEPSTYKLRCHLVLRPAWINLYNSFKDIQLEICFVVMNHIAQKSNADPTHRIGHLLGSGFISGLIVTGLLNPWDRGLYLSIVHARPFLRKNNFTRPYQGLLQTLLARSISSGMYFPLEQLTRQSLDHFAISQNAKNTIGGALVGLFTSVLINPFTFIKYQGWTSSESASFLRSYRTIRNDTGRLGFYRGCFSAILRDMIFGATFSGLRNQKMPGKDEKVARFLVNAASCFVATALSAPLNYSRNMQYASSTTKSCPSTIEILLNLKNKICLEEATLFRRLQSVQAHLRIGWGTGRVSIGMALTELIYSLLCEDRV